MSIFARSPRPIRSVLVANRGEIAVRVLKTCQRLGLRGLAVYSDADQDAPFVRLADAAARIGPSPARESYLNIPAIIAAAEKLEADAIHPGYGFLSENAAFAQACEDAGLIFVGPSTGAVASMGSKIEAKRIAAAAGVATVPGYHGDAQDAATLLIEARKIGFPVLIKASAGGGGRGMRTVEHEADFVAALDAARTEAQAAFGDARVLLERYIRNPRHLEVQLIGDRCGSLLHLFERDCSVQRNNQKILEEAPAPNLPDHTRQRLFDAALTLGRAISYDSAGTVEFIMEAGDDQPFFLEMNTRLQVEHPVTEAITGIDLVHWQLIAAAGEALPMTQEQLRPYGHAIEARLTAERADLGFQPATGRIATIVAPPDLRFDNGVADGSEIGLFYDSMVAKLVAHGRDRQAALDRLDSGLQRLVLLGLPSNQPFLRDAIRQPMFAEGRATTRFIKDSFPDGWCPDETALRQLRAIAVAAWIGGAADTTQRGPAGWSNPWLSRDALRVTAAARPALLYVLLADEYGSVEAELHRHRDGMSAVIDGTVIPLGAAQVDRDRIDCAPDGIGENFVYRRDGERLLIARHGLAIQARIVLKSEAPSVQGDDAGQGNRVVAPLHGLLTQLYVAVGDRVAAGMVVAHMEAMKLVHTLSAPQAGVVAAVRHAAGDIVPAGATLIEIDLTEDEESH